MKVRLQATFHSQGNLGNLFIQTDDTIVGIDQTITCINKSVNRQGYEKYQLRVKNLMEAMAKWPNMETKEMTRLREVLTAFTGTNSTKISQFLSIYVIHLRNLSLEFCEIMICIYVGYF